MVRTPTQLLCCKQSTGSQLTRWPPSIVDRVYGLRISASTKVAVTAGARPQVRDRATLYLKQLDGVAGGPDAICRPWPVPGSNLEVALHSYMDGPTDAPFLLVSPKP